MFLELEKEGVFFERSRIFRAGSNSKAAVGLSLLTSLLDSSSRDSGSSEPNRGFETAPYGKVTTFSMAMGSHRRPQRLDGDEKRGGVWKPGAAPAALKSMGGGHVVASTSARSPLSFSTMLFFLADYCRVRALEALLPPSVPAGATSERM